MQARYINQNGQININNDFHIIETEVKKGDMFKLNNQYSNWCTAWGYDINMTPIALTSPKPYYNEIITIPENIVYFKVFGQNDLIVQSITLNDKIESNKPIYFNENVGTVDDINSVTALTNIHYKNQNKIITLNTQAAMNSYVNLKTNKSINIGDFVVNRFKIKSNYDGNFIVSEWSTINEIHQTRFKLKANKEYDLYVVNLKHNESGSLNLQFATPAQNTNSLTIEIRDLMFTINDFNIYKSRDTYNTFKNLDTNDFIVDINGNGHFYDINTACEIIKRYKDVQNTPIQIHVKPGIYEAFPMTTFPFAGINKGANRISIIGENRDTCIINMTNTASLQSKVLEVGGECTIENLTINCLKDDSYTADTDLGHNCYCIHNDSFFNTDKRYTTKIKNCKLYSECHSPIGAGLRNNQLQIYEDIETISNAILGFGALYVHGPTTPNEANCEIQINNCTCISKDLRKAITLPDVQGSLPYTQIPVTIERTIGVTNGNQITDANFKESHNLTPQSQLNNVTEFNY